MKRRIQEAEMRAQSAERRAREAERKMKIADIRRQEAEASQQEAETRRHEAEMRLEVRLQQLEAQWVVERNEIQLMEDEIGRGSWAVVSVAKFRGIRVAAKFIHNLIISPYNMQLFRREMDMHGLQNTPPQPAPVHWSHHE